MFDAVADGWRRGLIIMYYLIALPRWEYLELFRCDYVISLLMARPHNNVRTILFHLHVGSIQMFRCGHGNSWLMTRGLTVMYYLIPFHLRTDVDFSIRELMVDEAASSHNI